MFSLLQRLGKHLREIEGSEPIDQIADEIGPKYQYGMAICFDDKGHYHGVKITEGTHDILYKSGPSAGCDYTIVSRFAAKLEKVVPRLQRNAEKICDWAPDPQSVAILDRCTKSAKEALGQIVEDLREHYPEDAGPEKRVFAYWATLQGDRISPFCSTPLVKEYLLEQGLESYAIQKSSTKVRMSEDHAACSVCGTDDTTVYGAFSEIACYNLDKQGMISGGFGYGQAARNFPVCQDCVLDILGAKTFVEAHLQFTLAGLRYWLLPDAMTKDVYNVLVKDLAEQVTRQTLSSALETITNQEKEVLEYLAMRAEEMGKTDTVTLNLFFYETSNAAWRIVGELRHVLPSRILEVYRAKRAVERIPEMEMSKRDVADGYHYTLATLRRFCGVADKQSDKRFLAYLDAVFGGKTMPLRTVITDLANGIITAQRKDPANERFRVRDAWATIQFLQRINVIHLERESVSMSETIIESNRYKEYMSQNPDFFGNDERRAAFLTGAYVGAVLYAQYKQRKSQPFAKKYLGRKLDRKRLVYLYDEARTKLVHYKATGLVAEIDPLLADTWVSVGENWSLSKEDTTFAFNLGQTLSRRLAEKVGNDDIEGPEVSK